MAAPETLLSVIMPAYNEALSIEPCYKRLKAVLEELPFSYEIIYVNDGSTDRTIEEVRKLARMDESIRLISFPRNFGKEVATTAGIEHAHGDAILVLDADGQHPPELIPQFIEAWEDGAQVVSGSRKYGRKEGFIKRYGSKLFYRLIKAVGVANLNPNTTDFRLIDASVQKAFLQFTEHDRIMRGLVSWIGFREVVINFQVNPRLGGKPSYGISKLIKLAMDSFVSLSMTPLYLSGYAGLVITPLALLGGIVVAVEQFGFHDPLHWKITGTAMLGILLLFFVGILLISQGLTALYISHIHTETLNRPLYVIDERNSLRA